MASGAASVLKSGPGFPPTQSKKHGRRNEGAAGSNLEKGVEGVAKGNNHPCLCRCAVV